MMPRFLFVRQPDLASALNSSRCILSSLWASVMSTPGYFFSYMSASLLMR